MWRLITYSIGTFSLPLTTRRDPESTQAQLDVEIPFSGLVKLRWNRGLTTRTRHNEHDEFS